MNTANIIAGGTRVTWKTDMDCDCADCMRSDSLADNCLVYDTTPNPTVDPAGASPAPSESRC